MWFTHMPYIEPSTARSYYLHERILRELSDDSGYVPRRASLIHRISSHCILSVIAYNRQQYGGRTLMELDSSGSLE